MCPHNDILTVDVPTDTSASDHDADSIADAERRLQPNVDAGSRLQYALPITLRTSYRMAPLVRFDAVSVTFGEQRVLIDADFSIEPGERVCLIGRNGAGKSTTLKLITGAQEPDDGAVEKPAQSALEPARAEARRRVAPSSSATSWRAAWRAQLERIAEFERLTAAAPHDRAALREIEALQREIDAGGGWNVDVRVGPSSASSGCPASSA